MPKSCFDDFLTNECASCPYWKNDEKQIGCCVPFPIMECKAFAQMYAKEELKQKINNQREENIRLYKIFQYRLHEENMQPLINTWRQGSKRIKELLNQLYELEKEEKKSNKEDTINKKHINGYGEATDREITSSTYIRADRRLSKEIMRFVGG